MFQTNFFFWILSMDIRTRQLVSLSTCSVNSFLSYTAGISFANRIGMGEKGLKLLQDKKIKQLDS